MFSATAFMCVYNEADILPWTLSHLRQQGVGVYVIDNWSTDGSDALAQRFDLIGYERWPADGPSRYYEWGQMLRRVEELAQRSTADWCIHHDADEIRRSPRPGETLLQALQRVESEGFNAVKYQVYHFTPTDDLYTGDPETHFRYYSMDAVDCRNRQIKTWKNMGQRVDLATTGGHNADFTGRHVYPGQFILKHYPMRTSAQAERKIIHERMERYSPEELAKAWHVQYNGIAQTRNWIHDTSGLKLWDKEN